MVKAKILRPKFQISEAYKERRKLEDFGPKEEVGECGSYILDLVESRSRTQQIHELRRTAVTDDGRREEQRSQKNTIFL